MKTIIGIDEAGRGPIAGPVAVGAFAFKIKNYELIIKNVKDKYKLPLRDSKKLSAKQREEWFAIINKWQKAGKCDYAVTLVSASDVDKIGISKAIQSGLNKSLEKVKAKNTHQIFLDGGLKAPKEFKNQKTVIKGDEKIPVISLASICAKVVRDAHMTRLNNKYPFYSFNTHKGYGTKAHYKAIEKYGISKIHRKTFLKTLVK